MYKPERSTQKEYLDLGPEAYTHSEYDQCLDKLETIGKWLGGDAATLSALNSLAESPGSILDVGCGGGGLAQLMAKKYADCSVSGVDIDPWAIAYAENYRTQNELLNLKFEHRSDKTLSNPGRRFDVVTCSLVCHHMADDEIIDFLKHSATIANYAIIINDLHRHLLASLLFPIIAPIFFRNRLIFHDGLLSIKRSFVYQDWKYYLREAGFSPDQYTITWKWAFRWFVVVRLNSSLR